MSDISSDDGAVYNSVPPDIVQAALPFLSPQDIRSLSHTNRYFYKLLNYKSSETLWHDLFCKVYETSYSDDEPFGDKIMLQNFSSLSWQERFKLRSEEAKLHTWGCLKHARLGFTATSNPHIPEADVNGIGRRLRYGVNTPELVPWFSSDESKLNGDSSIVQLSGGGFSFQILTRSGKLYTTGSTFSGGHVGPGPAEGQHDFNPFREAVHNLEASFPHTRDIVLAPVGLPGSFPGRSTQHHGPTPTLGPHSNIYEELEQMDRNSAQTVPNNEHIKRVYPRNAFEIFTSDSNSFKVDKEQLDSIKFVAVSSGRSHFIAMDTKHDLYSWDSPDSDYGVKLAFEGLPPRETNPIWKIASGWDLNCIYVHQVGLVVWNKREALKKGELCSKADYSIIPQTGEITGPRKVIDFACFQGDCVFYITNDGENLWKYSHGLVQQIKLPIAGKFVRISVCYSLLVLFTDNECYTVKIENGNVDNETLIELKLEDPDDRVISLATGDYHNIALTLKGQIYAWGLESQLCGCLGLGSPEHVVEHENIGRWDSIRNMRVAKPTKICLDREYVCVAVSAGGWQSGALIIKR
ncbi:hypothetical protein HG536_0F01890 [Torulaspora globosa]|uniref:F-box domain-containing protein n=1 Tax=Torulaspora globosa TaxID=48254 RepID=A0A7G3ZK28_9SACH|nr:uncharacterized protein HG536_0F01890 [Torulaspora globosa]QLL33864.1 hypothetical protein HG536_0F01890 [Torulaspora globosa]